MNRQKLGGIEWTMIPLPNGQRRPGYTWNPIGGCLHGCKWTMPDGSVASCYAEAVAEGIATKSYPHGFDHHYWRPDKLDAPRKVKEPSGIFVGSMADIFAPNVEEDHVRQVLEVIRQVDWHIVQALTKHAPGILKYLDLLPPNLWVGVSSPPDEMHGKVLSLDQKERMFSRACKVLKQVQSKGNITFWSLEPLTFDFNRSFIGTEYVPDWIIMGAASNGRKKYQPDPDLIELTHRFAQYFKVPVFHKGNLKISGTPRYQGFPTWSLV